MPVVSSSSSKSREPLAETVERRRLVDDPAAWRRWGPYLSDRAWGTVREDDSVDGNAWKSFPHDHARSRAFRWGEDGIAGFSDLDQRLCFALALWNGKDPILKERFFGLDNSEGNHGEDVKEYYFHRDALPSHALLDMRYQYPQAAFPYDQLVATNKTRARHEPEYELVDTGIFADNRYFQVDIAYAKAAPDDTCIRITVTNCGPETAELHLLPTLWFRNTWSWGPERQETGAKPVLSVAAPGVIRAEHERLGSYALHVDGEAALLFCDNETNVERLFHQRNTTMHPKDGINDAVVHGTAGRVNPTQTGTKAAAHRRVSIAAGQTVVMRLRLRPTAATGAPFADHEAVFAERRKDADAFYAALQPAQASADHRLIQRQAWAGMIWSKQWFGYSVPAWQRQQGPQGAVPQAHWRNKQWHHFEAADIISMPDAWEYPWFAAWDLGFHAISLAYVDPEFAKEQLLLMVSERYQHPNGAIAAYEWNFDDVNPPVLARTAWRTYHVERETYGRADRAFLEIMFQKLALNFAWWVNRKDASGTNIFGGGFLGLDNIGVFDRSSPLPTGGHLEQSDGTSWMAMFSLDLGTIALELARENPIYRKLATKYFIHFLYVAGSMNDVWERGGDLWDEQDGFYYDLLRLPDRTVPLKVRSMVGLIPLYAITLIPPIARDDELAAWFDRYLERRPRMRWLLDQSRRDGENGIRMISLVDGERLGHILARMLDPAEFLSDFGIRGLSKAHAADPYQFMVGIQTWSVGYVPAESDTPMFGGNSNWRGPIWLPVNYFLITSLKRFHRFFGDSYRIEHPRGSGQQRTLAEIADDLSDRLVAIFAQDSHGRRPCNGGVALFDGPWGQDVPFFEYFHGDTGRGVGASHQTGWTGLVAALIQERGGADAVPMIGADAQPPI